MTIENMIGGQEGAAHEILMFLCVAGLLPLGRGALGAQDWLLPRPGTPQADCPELGRRECVFVPSCEGGLGTCTSNASLQAVPPAF